MIDQARAKKRIYDVLVPLSGGKDSCYLLYFISKKYDLKCLAVTWDNGFLTWYHARLNHGNTYRHFGRRSLILWIKQAFIDETLPIFLLKYRIFLSCLFKRHWHDYLRAQLAFNIPLTDNRNIYTHRGIC